ncbi:hypothetical protein ACFL33_00770 [Pseudomonadota bacterium]
MSLFRELKRRNVFRVATAYVVVSWLLLQVSDVLLDFTGAPPWVGKAILGFLLVGFVVALVLSWLFESTSEGIKRDTGDSQVDAVRARRLNILTILAAVGVAVLFAWQQFKPPETVPTVDTSAATTTGQPTPVTEPEIATNDASIAVLPFADLSPEGDQEYFTDGISEEILNVLATVDGLAVASRTSSFAFKDQKDLGIPEIGNALEVRHVLEGSVRAAGSNIRVTAQLIDASTDKHLWSNNFDRELTAENVFEIQDEIASAIVNQLSKSLNLATLENSAIHIEADTNNLDAYQLFLQGRQRFRVRSTINLPGTIEVFQRAVDLDPEFARAWAGLAAVLVVAPSWGVDTQDEEYHALSQQAARRAIEIDDSLALPYAVLGNGYRGTNPVDFIFSNQMLSDALERDPRETSALLWRGINWIALGFFDRAIEDITKCQEIDPGYENCFVWEGLAQLYAGNLEVAFQAFELAAGINASSQTRPFAFALARHGEKLSALLALAWNFNDFEFSVDPDLVYQAVTDPGFDEEQAFEEYSAEYMELRGVPPDLAAQDGVLAIVFGRYEEMTASVNDLWWWEKSFPKFTASPHRKRLMREVGIVDYWREIEFPPQCRPIGDDDFECD